MVLIDRNEAIDAIWKMYPLTYAGCIDTLNALPEIQTGKWKVFYECPYCGEISTEPSAKCPCCQKDMV